jgi:hypothetical protein
LSAIKSQTNDYFAQQPMSPPQATAQPAHALDVPTAHGIDRPSRSAMGEKQAKYAAITPNIDARLDP